MALRPIYMSIAARCDLYAKMIPYSFWEPTLAKELLAVIGGWGMVSFFQCVAVDKLPVLL